MDIPRPLNDWSKTHEGMPGIPVRQHLLAVACVADALLRRFPRLCARCCIQPSSVLFLAASHDVGKLSLDFLQKSSIWLKHQGLTKQAGCEGWKEVYTRQHSLISCQSLQKFLLDNNLANKKTAACWSAVIGAHHGNIVSKYSSAPPVLKGAKLVLENDRQSCLKELWGHFGSPGFPDIQNKEDPHLWCVAGLVTLADWLGSDEDFFPADKPLDEAELRQRASDAVESIGLGLPPVTQGLSFADIFPGRSPYPFQEETVAVVNGPGIYIIEAPMGMGKTEAALWVAYHLLARGHADGIFFALPTQATSNRMYLRFADFVHRICPQMTPAQLIHGNSWLQDDLKALVSPPTPGDVADPCWFNSARRSLFAPFGVGTVDQALLAVLAVRHFALRRFALAGKVVIVDEVHTYDMYTGRLVRYLCDELEKLGCTIIVLSATLTEDARCSLLSLPITEENNDAPYPRISGRVANVVLPERYPPSIQDKTIRIEHPEREAALKEALELAGTGSQILWISNTVAQAREDFTALRQMAARQEKYTDMGLLHSRFPFYRREALEREWLARLGPEGNREKGAILVATQIVEQSVDLDADVLFSELAPTDMLLQRLGRLWRHPRMCRPVASPAFCLLREKATCNELRHMDATAIKTCLGEKAVIYSPYALLRSLELWESLECITVPSEIRNLMARTYAESLLPSGWEVLHSENYGRELAEERLADMATDIWQEPLDDEAALKTRLSAEDALLVLCRYRDGNRVALLEGGEITLPKNGQVSLPVAKKLHRNTVRIPCSCLTGRPYDRLLAPYHIDDGCLVAGAGAMDVPNLRAGRKLYWDDTLGVIIRKEKR